MKFCIIYVRRDDTPNDGDDLRFAGQKPPFVHQGKNFDTPMEAMGALAMSDCLIGGYRYQTVECWSVAENETLGLGHLQWKLDIA